MLLGRLQGWRLRNLRRLPSRKKGERERARGRKKIHGWWNMVRVSDTLMREMRDNGELEPLCERDRWQDFFAVWHWVNEHRLTAAWDFWMIRPLRMMIIGVALIFRFENLHWMGKDFSSDLDVGILRGKLEAETQYYVWLYCNLLYSHVSFSFFFFYTII